MDFQPITVRVEYYAQMREATRKSAERIRALVTNPRELYEQLQRQYEFPLGIEHLRVAINHDMSEWNAALKEGDVVTFLPPVAGG